MADGACIVWGGAKDADGYGRLKVLGVVRGAHVVAYEAKHGRVPEGTELDHLCRRRDCVNPDHVEAVTHRENVLRGNCIAARNARKTHCKRGHEFSAVNTRIVNTGRGRSGRRCLACRKERGR